MARTTGLNRKQRKALARQLRSDDPGLEVMHPHAAGIDVGNSAHYVAVRPDRDPESVRRFECFTADLHRLADWLQQCGVTTVAMQSTGVYWIPLYEILDARGLEVYLVNARHTRNLPGRKSDVQESQWLLKLHTYGLLRNSFHPPADIRVVRTFWRQRGDHVQAISTCIQRMQKALTQMNIQLANVISDLSGWTGSGSSGPSSPVSEIRRNSPPCAIPAFTRHRRRSPRASKARGSQTCCLCCNKKSRCMTHTSNGSSSAISNSNNTSKVSQTRSLTRPRTASHR